MSIEFNRSRKFCAGTLLILAGVALIIATMRDGLPSYAGRIGAAFCWLGCSIWWVRIREIRRLRKKYMVWDRPGGPGYP